MFDDNMVLRKMTESEVFGIAMSDSPEAKLLIRAQVLLKIRRKTGTFPIGIINVGMGANGEVDSIVQVLPEELDPYIK